MTREECLKKAEQIVNGEREGQYGSPEDSFQRIANLWNGYLKGIKLTPTDVAMMMALMKIARINGNVATEDSFVDLAGYAACGCEIATEVAKHNIYCIDCAYYVPVDKDIHEVCKICKNKDKFKKKGDQMEGKLKIVDYAEWCNTCKYKDKPENTDPCWDCLTTPVNEDSHKPILWEEKNE